MGAKRRWFKKMIQMSGCVFLSGMSHNMAVTKGMSDEFVIFTDVLIITSTIFFTIATAGFLVSGQDTNPEGGDKYEQTHGK